MPNGLDIDAESVDELDGAAPSGGGPLLEEDVMSSSTSPRDEDEGLIRALVRRGQSGRTPLSLNTLQSEALVNRVIRDFNDASASMNEFKKLHALYWKAWRPGILEPKSKPYTGASNVVLPLTSSFLEQMKSRLLKAMIGTDKTALFSSLDGRLKAEDLYELNDWFQWELEEVVQLPVVLLDICHELLIDGISLPYAEYAHEERILYSLREFEIAEGQSLFEQLNSAIGVIFENEEPETKATGDGLFEVDHQIQPGEKRTAKVSFSIKGDTLVAEVERSEVIFDGVRVKRISIPDDLVVINSACEVEDLSFFGSRLWLSVHDWLAGVHGKKFIELSKDMQEEVLARSSSKSFETIMRPVATESDRVEGTDSKDQTANDYSRKWIEVYRWEGWWAPEPDYTRDSKKYVNAEERAVVAWVDSRSRKLLKIAYLEELNKDGGRTPVKFDFITQPDRFFSIGFCEWMEHLQTEIDGIHNQSLDAGILSNMPWGLYEPTAGNMNTIYDLQPGKLYPSKNPAGINFPKTQFTPIWNLNMENSLLSYAKQQAGLGDPQTGTFVSKRTSATEFASTAASMDIRTETICIKLFTSFRKLLYRIFGLYQQFAKDGRVFQVTGLSGERILKSLKRDRLNGKIALHLTGSIQRLNSQLERDVAINMLSILINPLLMQTGISKADTIYAAIEKIVKASNYTGVPIHKPDMPADSDPPNVEHKRMLSGEMVSPSMGENFSEHLEAHMALATSPKVNTYLPTVEARSALAEHIKASMEMQRAVQIMRQMQQVQAEQMQASLGEMGVRPGLAGGSQAGDQAQPGTQEEGVMGGMNVEGQ